MVQNPERDERMAQVGLAYRLTTDNFAYADMQDADFYLLGYRDDQVESDLVSYANVMARARDIVVKAIVGAELPKVFKPEEKEEEKQDDRVTVPAKPQPDVVAENDAYAKDKSGVDPDSIPSVQKQLTEEDVVELKKEDAPASKSKRG